MGETNKRESEGNVNWKCEERISNEQLVKIKTEKARIDGLPPYLKAFQGQPLHVPFIIQAAPLAIGEKYARTDFWSLMKMQGAKGKHRCGLWSQVWSTPLSEVKSSLTSLICSPFDCKRGTAAPTSKGDDRVEGKNK